MKIPLLPVYIFTGKTLSKMSNTLYAHFQERVEVLEAGAKQYQLTKQELAILMKNSIEMEIQLRRFGIKAPAVGARIVPKKITIKTPR